jgi:hypothetical protein
VGKALVVLDDPRLDLHTSEGRLISHAKALGPAKELERINARVADSHAARRYTRAWPGGVPTYGYRTEYSFVDDKKRKVLVMDEYMCTVLHEMRRWVVVDKEPIKRVSVVLNDRGELTAKDRWRRMTGVPIRHEMWSSSSVKKLLTSPALLGQKVSNSNRLFLPDGNPLIVADPVFDNEQWQSLQAAIATGEREPYRKYDASPLSGVTFCGLCQAAATHVVVDRRGEDGQGAMYRYYRCTNQRQPKPCPKISMRAEDVEALLAETFLAEAGALNVATKSWLPGEDHTETLAKVRTAIDRLENERDTAVAWDDEDESS